MARTRIRDAKAGWRETSPIARVSVGHNLAIAAIIFVVAHAVLLIGLTSPEKFVFDEVHYVPAARQMLEQGKPSQVLNPMHPPLAKELIAVSIATFGDSAFGWRYPAALFGALAIVAVYLCALALFEAQAPAVAAALIAFFNQMVFVQSRIAMLDIFALAFSLLAIAEFMRGFGAMRPHRWFALAGIGFGLATGCKWSGLFPLAVSIAIIAVIRLLQGWRTAFADPKSCDWYRPDRWPDFWWYHVVACFVALPLLVYLSTFVPLTGVSLADLIEAQRRIFADNTTSAIPGHTYMSSWPSWPFLVRPVWYLFDKVGEDRIAAVVFLGNPLVLWPSLLALAVCLRDFVKHRGATAFLILSFYFGSYLALALMPRALAFLYYYLPAATILSLAPVYALTREGTPRGLLWVFVAIAAAGFVAMLPISAAFVGTSMATFNRLMLFQSWI
jgi:dolichyl-phosphate-mannose-protein mannosyltransferase